MTQPEQHHIKIGQIWRHRSKSEHRCTVVQVSPYTWGSVELYHHKSKRTSIKQIHYFLYDYVLVLLQREESYDISDASERRTDHE